MESLRIDFFKERVFVMTPKGDVIDLPEGSCPIDLAYQIHTDLGHKCQGAKVNNKIVPLSKPLQNWDVVEIISGKEKNPKRSWLNFVKTTVAKSRIKNWLKTQAKEENLNQGLEAVNQMLGQLKNTTWDKLPRNKKEEVLKIFPYSDLQSLIIAIGQGDVSPRQIIKNIFKEEDIFEQKQIRKEKAVRLSKIPIKIGGEKNLLIQMAKCCSPVPGEKICAYITRNRGAIIHRKACPIARGIENKFPERLIDAIWEDSKEKKFVLSTKILAQDRIGLIKDLTTAITNAGLNIFSIKGEPPKGGVSSIVTKIEVSNIDEAEKIFLIIRTVKGILEIKRE
jgi:GTP pyrophosphokinase